MTDIHKSQINGENTVQYRIVVQDRISVQVVEITILDKHTGSNRMVQADFFLSKRG